MPSMKLLNGGERGMKLEVTEIEINDGERAMANITRDIENCVEINVDQNVFDLQSWREFSLLVEQAIIKLTEQDKND